MRSRFIDYAPNGKKLKLTPSDLAILSLLRDYPAGLPVPFIGELLGYSKTFPLVKGKPVLRYPYLSVKLRNLRKIGAYIYWPKAARQSENVLARFIVYALTDKGHELAEQHDLAERRRVTAGSPKEQLGVNMVRASFILGAQQTGATYVTTAELMQHPAFPEAVRSSDKPFHIPVSFTYYTSTGKAVDVRDTYARHDDSPFAVQVAREGKPVSWFCAGIEFDCDTEGLKSKDADRASVDRHLHEILALLDEGGYRRHYGFPKVSVLFVALGERRMQAIMDRLAHITRGKGHERILFAYMDDFTDYAAYPSADGSMLTRPWHRVGHPDFKILEALGVE